MTKQTDIKKLAEQMAGSYTVFRKGSRQKY